MSDRCPSDESWLALAEGRLPEVERRPLLSHSLRCAECQALLAALVPAGSSVSALTEASAAPPDPAPWRPPATFGHYRLLRPLGQGAMGVVYLAEDTLLERPVAVKFLSEALLPDPLARERLLQEARAIARLSHPNVLAVHQVGEIEGRPYLVCERVEGRGLEELALPVPQELLRSIALGLCRGLGAAHRRGVLHRDIKPQNAMLTEDGGVKLLDFGLAKVAGDVGADWEGSAAALRGPHPELTSSGALVGTPRYLAPELWSGAVATCRSDVYALGALLYLLASAQAPYPRADSVAALRRLVLEQEPAPLRTVAPWLDPRLSDLIDRCLRRDPAERFASGEALSLALDALTAPPAPLPEGNPYRGLQAFDSVHRALFFGRAEESLAVLELLRGEPLVTVSGDSGVGKSSLCQAGVAPLVAAGALREGRRWQTLRVVPGRYPVQALLRALQAVVPREALPAHEVLLSEPQALLLALHRALRADLGLLLLLDQLEELVTQSDVAEAALCGALLEQLGQRLPGLRVLLCARGDFLTRLSEVPGLAGPLTRALYLLAPLREEGLRQAIEGPAQATAVTFESSALVTELVQATAGSRGGLPLLQFTLAALWDARDPERRQIQSAALRSLGGVAGALARHADQVVASLLPAQRAAARRLLRQLVSAQGTRARRSAGELLTEDPVEGATLEALVRGRLLVVTQSGEDEVARYEIAHEVMLQGWGTLRGWLQEDVERGAVQGRLVAAAEEWERLGCDDALLWPAARIAEVRRLGLEEDALPPLAAGFLALAQRRVQRRGQLRRAVLAGLVLVAVVWLYGWERRSREPRQGDVPVMEIARAVWVQARAQQPGAEVQALREALSLVESGEEPGHEWATQALNAAVGAARRSMTLVHTDARDLTIAPDSQRLLLADRGGSLVDLGDRAPRGALLEQPAQLLSVAFSPSGRLIAAADEAHALRIFAVEPGGERPLAVLAGHSQQINAVAFSPDSARILSVSSDRSARLWDTRTLRQVVNLGDHQAPFWAGGFSPGGERLFTLGADAVWLYDGRTGARVAELRGHTGKVLSAGFSPDGALLASGGADGRVLLWDARSGALRRSLGEHGGAVLALAFSPDGTQLLTGSGDGAARLFAVLGGEGPRVLSGHRGPLTAVLYARAALLITTGEDRTVRLWEPRSGRLLATLVGHQRVVQRAALSPDGRKLVTLALGEEARRWDLDLIAEASVSGPPGPASASAVQRKLLQAIRVGSLRARDSSSPWDMLHGHVAEVLGVATSADGLWVATAGADGTARVWDSYEGVPACRLIVAGQHGAVRGVVLAPDGAVMITLSQDGKAEAWDTRRGQRLLSYLGSYTGAAYSADGQRLYLYAGGGTSAPGAAPALIQSAPETAEAALRSACGLLRSSGTNPGSTFGGPAASCASLSPW